MRTWLCLLPAVSIAALPAGCRTSDPFDDAVAAKLAGIDAKLSKIVEAQTPPPPAKPAGPVRRKADHEALAKIKPLPEKPTEAEVAAYAKAIFDLSSKQNAFSYDDPQYAMIERIGPGFIRVLAPYLSNYYFRRSLSLLVTPQDRAEVLRNLPDQPQLMTVLPFVGFKPEAEVRRAILEAARRNNDPKLIFPVHSYLPMLAEDPETWAELVELSYRKPFLRAIFNKSLEGLDSAARQEKFRKLWEGQKELKFPDSWRRYSLLLTAARGGVPEALELLLARPEFNGVSVNRHQRNVLAALLPDAAQVPPGEMLAWYRSHRDRLRFDPAANCYRLDSTNH